MVTRSGLLEAITSGYVFLLSSDRCTLTDIYDQVPMVAPFFGCTFGGFLYDVLIFTGESPLNEEWWGIPKWIPGMRQHLREDQPLGKDSPV